MKKLVCMVLTVLLTLSLALFSVSAEGAKQIHSMMVFGDSIACGYMLDGFDPEDLSKAKDCFVNLIAAEYGLTVGTDCINEAKAGLTSEEIMNAVYNTDAATLKEKDLFILSSGANDIIRAFADVLYRYFYQNSSKFEPYGITASSFSTLDGLEKNFVNLMTNPEIESLRQELVENCTSDMVMKRYTDTEDVLEQNLKRTLSAIIDSGSDAEIYLLSPYNPIQALNAKNDLTDLIDTTIRNILNKELEMAKDESYHGKLHIVNLYDAFRDDYPKYVLTEINDIHPTKAGHHLIAELILNDLDPDREPSPEPSESSAADMSGASSLPSPEKSQPPTPPDASHPSDVSDPYQRPPVPPDPNQSLENPENPSAPSAPLQPTAPSAPKDPNQRDDFPVYILLGAALVAVAAIIIHFIITRRKK